MRRLCLTILTFTLLHSAMAQVLRVDEDASRVTLNQRTYTVVLAATASAAVPSAQLNLSLIASNGSQVAASSSSAHLKAGPNKLASSLMLLKLPKNEDDLLWYRLKYGLTANGRTLAHGILPLFNSIQDFSVHVSAPAMVVPGRKFFVRVYTSHPVLTRPVGGVAVTAQVQTNAEDKIISTAAGTTDAGGYAVLSMSLPANQKNDTLEIKVSARRGAVQKSAENDLKVGTPSVILVQTDKPLYQPGQVLHLRALVFGEGRRALPGEKIDFQVQDEDGTTVFRNQRATSRFGVAAADWSIPDRVKLGSYRIVARTYKGVLAEGDHASEDDDWSAGEDRRTVRISRYELPTFVVNAKPDRSYYLPGQKPSVEINAAYLFGKPVEKASARVTRLEGRSWDFAKQKWDIEEGETVTGITDQKGLFHATLDLSPENTKLDDESYRKFRDITYTAYVTDPSTGRTEERRFDVRLTRDPIHVYYVSRGLSQRGLPREFFLSTSYADGSPAQCDVQVRTIGADGLEHVIATAHTSRYGVARLRDIEAEVSSESGDLPLILVARDHKGATGVSKENIWLGSRENHIVRVVTEKTILVPEEPIEAQVYSSSGREVVVELASEGKLLRSFTVKLWHHGAMVRIPYSSEFKGELTLSAISMHHNSMYSNDYGASASRSVIYPQNRGLKVDLHFDRSEYQPGQKAEATVQVSTAQGAAVPGVIGAVVFDKAVEERARIDEDLRVPFGFGSYGAWWYRDAAKLANLTRSDLDRIDPTETIPEDLDIAADFLLNAGGSGGSVYSPVFGDDDDSNSPADVYKDEIQRTLSPLLAALKEDDEELGTLPRNQQELDALLQRHHLTWSSLRDPWGSEFIPTFSLDSEDYVLDISSPGPDKLGGTDDDFSAAQKSVSFYAATERKITRALEQNHRKTGGFVRDLPSLRAALGELGVDASTLLDPWGHPYLFEFGVDGAEFTVTARTRGADGRPGQEYTAGMSEIDYFAETRAAIDKLLPGRIQASGKVPATAEEFKAMLLPEIRLDDLRDPYGRPYLVRTAALARYSDRRVENNQQVSTEPVTVWSRMIQIRSSGADGIPDNGDDFGVASFSAVLSEVTSSGKVSAPSMHTLFTGNTGGISGLITDPTGAVIPNIKVTAVNAITGNRYETTTDSNGVYLLRDLPPGVYEVSAQAAGFVRTTVRGVIVRAQELVTVNGTLRVGAVTQTIEVSAEKLQISTESASLSNPKQAATTDLAQQATVTPRLRQYFPETLLWQPAIQTDRRGRAHINWTFADNLTTWKMSLIVSTLDGRLATLDKEVKSFQPFFVEHDPPKVLTLGDRISLPVVVRNYTNKAEQVRVEMPPADWFRSTSVAMQQASLAPGSDAKVIFPFEAIATTSAGRQRVLATSARVGDAVERSVAVHPNGAELSRTAGGIVSGNMRLNFEVPSEAIPGSARVDLKIYPDLLAQVTESLEGMLERPWGCGEQTISSTYPSVLLLKFEKDSKRPLGPLHDLAMRYLSRGYAQLLTFADDSGGFTYWGRGEPDLALTAYAASFLHDVSEFAPVDPEVLLRARRWLLQHQRLDGSWVAQHWYADSPLDDAILTSYVARVLAGTGMTNSKDKSAGAENAAIRRALDYVAAATRNFSDPYLYAGYGLAEMAAGQPQRAEFVLAKLRAAAQTERDGSFWELQTNTPFYGWGRAGRVETTALVIQLLDQVGHAEDRALANRGLEFLIEQKDRYGAWYSTQTTVNVIDALLLLASREGAESQSPLRISVNGSPQTLPPSTSQIPAAQVLDISSLARPGANAIEISGGNGVLSAQIVSDYYVPWSSTLAVPKPGPLKMSVKCDRTHLEVGASATCAVLVERLGSAGHGMMIAEIGIPPGVDVDREALQKQVSENGWDLSSVDVLPDRIVAYVWPRAGGNKFSVTFKARMAMDALSAPSTLFDYYNPDASVTIPPDRFTVVEPAARAAR